MYDTTEEDELHFATVVEPGETYRGAHGIHIPNPSKTTFNMYVQVVDELNFTGYRYFTPGQGWRVVHKVESPEDAQRI